MLALLQDLKYYWHKHRLGQKQLNRTAFNGWLLVAAVPVILCQAYEMSQFTGNLAQQVSGDPLADMTQLTTLIQASGKSFHISDVVERLSLLCTIPLCYWRLNHLGWRWWWLMPLFLPLPLSVLNYLSSGAMPAVLTTVTGIVSFILLATICTLKGQPQPPANRAAKYMKEPY